MILDYEYVFDGSFSDASQVTGMSVAGFTAGGLASTNVIDLVNARDMGTAPEPYPIKVMVLVTTGFTTTGTASSTMTVRLQGAPTNTAGASWVTYAESGPYASASLTAGVKIGFDLPPVNPDGGALPRYLRLSYELGGPGSTFSAASVIAALVLGSDMAPGRAYPSGTTVVN